LECLIVRRIGAYIAIGALAAVISAPSTSAAFGLRIGPLHLGLPLFRHSPGFRHRHRIALHRRLHKGAAIYDKADLGGTEEAPGVNSALLYPGLALPILYGEIFWPTFSSGWPFGYADIFRTAFAKSRPDHGAHACQQPDRATAIVARIKRKIRPRAAQLRLLQTLGGALGRASGYLIKSCPNEIPAQPVARLQLIQSQIQMLSMALDIVRPPLQQFEQSLNASQRRRLAAKRSNRAAAAPGCAASPTPTDWSIEQIDQSVQPSAAQRGALADLKQAFAAAAGDLDAHCPKSLPATPLARLESTEARLDASWRAVLSIRVALANFARRLSDQQRRRFDAMDFAAAR
jgi:LTXXQ motif family protein